MLVGLCSIVFFVLCRCEPHIASFSPLLGAILFGSAYLPKRDAWAFLFGGLLFSDVAYAVIFGTPVFGAWTLFTYTGFAAVLFVGQYQRVGLLGALFVVLVYWLWTNLGSWLVSGMYAFSVGGLAACFWAALPFLQHALLAMVVVYLTKRLLAAYFASQSAAA
jgi:hypothetical protein